MSAENPGLQRRAENEEVLVNNEGNDEQEDETLDLVPLDAFYSAQDVDEMQQEWQETHQRDLVELQRKMQSQLDAQKKRIQQNVGTTARTSTGGVLTTGQSRLSMSAPAFVPGHTLGVGTTFYNSTPR